MNLVGQKIQTYYFRSAYWSFLSESGKQLAIIRARSRYVQSLAFSPYGTTLASAGPGSDNAVLLWDVASGKPVGEPIPGHDRFVSYVAFSPDGRMLATGGDKSYGRELEYHFVNRRITSPADFLDLLNGVDLAILAADTPRVDIFSWMNKASYDTGVSVLYALGMAQTFLGVGPLVVPGRTACFECSMPPRNLSANDPVAAFINGRHRHGIVVPSIMIATGIMTFEALKHITGFDDCTLYNRRLMVDLKLYTMRFEEVSRRKGCPYCSSGPPVHQGSFGTASVRS